MSLNDNVRQVFVRVKEAQPPLTRIHNEMSSNRLVTDGPTDRRSSQAANKSRFAAPVLLPFHLCPSASSVVVQPSPLRHASVSAYVSVCGICGGSAPHLRMESACHKTESGQSVESTVMDLDLVEQANRPAKPRGKKQSLPVSTRET